MIKSTFRLVNKPHERTILIAICKVNGLEFSYDEANGFATVIAENSSSMDNTRQFFQKITAYAYKRLAFLYVDNLFSSVPIKTLQSEFMKAFTIGAVLMITGDTMKPIITTEAARAGLIASTNFDYGK